MLRTLICVTQCRSMKKSEGRNLDLHSSEKKWRTFQRDTVVVYLFTKNRLTRNLHGPGTIGYNHRQQRGSMTLQNESENMHTWLLSSRGEHGEQRTAQTQHRIKYQAWYLAHTCRTCNGPGKPSLSLTELHHFWQPENKPGSNSVTLTTGKKKNPTKK